MIIPYIRDVLLKKIDFGNYLLTDKSTDIKLYSSVALFKIKNWINDDECDKWATLVQNECGWDIYGNFELLLENRNSPDGLVTVNWDIIGELEEWNIENMETKIEIVNGQLVFTIIAGGVSKSSQIPLNLLSIAVGENAYLFDVRKEGNLITLIMSDGTEYMFTNNQLNNIVNFISVDNGNVLIVGEDNKLKVVPTVNFKDAFNVDLNCRAF